MLVGYVSDERYVAIPGVLLEFEIDGQSIEATSRATGAVYADVAPSPARVTLYKDGYGQKSVKMAISDGKPYHFRLLKDGLLAYMWPKWVKGGEKAEFRVHSVEEYKLELWRYGATKEFIQLIGWYDEHGPLATMQITPDGDFTQTGVQWNKFGYTSPHHLQFLTAPERTGLYYLHASTPSGRFFSAPWIVAPSQPTAKIAVLASNITWNAYNNFGGRSNYASPIALPEKPTVNARLELKRYTDPNHLHYDSDTYAPLSFDRPEPINHIPEATHLTDPIAGRAPNHIAPAEWRFLGWLEQEGFAYDFYGETQLHDGTLNLDAYKVLIISTHPEYWSREMYFAVKDWVHNRGGKLLYLGGNGINAEVEFPNDQTMIVQNANERVWGHNSTIESRFHARVGESEANLLGIVYDPRGIMTAAPYRVINADHWAFRGTRLHHDETFGEASLHERVPGGASGHETDKISASSPANIELLATGLNPDEGGAQVVTYKTESGGAVFSAGSITWVSSILVDVHVSRITANVLEQFLK
ncbi:MAG: N,N-dimethylformamidase beta subunit family domain-containing protein [Chloroflexota bacterium]